MSTAPTAPRRRAGFDRSRAAWFRAAQPDLWDLPPAGARRLFTLLARALTRRCPYCGHGHIFRSWLTLKKDCPHCGIPFEREEGYFVGTYAVNLVSSLFLGFGSVMLILAFTDLSVLQIQVIGVGVAIALPLIGYPFASSVWMAIDLMLDPPEKTDWEEVDRPDLAIPRGAAGARTGQRSGSAGSTTPRQRDDPM